jgi:hypothetical protein
MRIEAITVSIHFSDYLIHCVGNNKHFDRWIIVTVADDEKTIDICKQHNIEYILSKNIYINRYDNGPAMFAKGRAINEGLERLKKNDWLVHIDSDIILPKYARKVIDGTDLSIKKLYCSKGRYMAKNIADLSKPMEELPFSAEKTWMGFFQLWHSNASQVYHAKSSNAERDDVGFRRRWKRSRRGIVKFSCIHLGPTRENWNGRISPGFI